jgi:hypothetical protein
VSQPSFEDSRTSFVTIAWNSAACIEKRLKLVLDFECRDLDVWVVDWCMRCHKTGLRVERCHDVRIVHERQRLSYKRLFSKTSVEHLKGLGYYFMKHGYLLEAPVIRGCDLWSTSRRTQRSIGSGSRQQLTALDHGFSTFAPYCVFERFLAGCWL